jgi:hypothetical protein
MDQAHGTDGAGVKGGSAGLTDGPGATDGTDGAGVTDGSA